MNNLGYWKRPIFDQSLQISTLHQAHNQVSPLWVPPIVVEGDDVQVFQLGDQLGFGFETADEIRLVGEFGQDHLDRHLAVDNWLVSAINSAIGSFTDGLQEIISLYGAGQVSINKILRLMTILFWQIRGFDFDRWR